jgi:hypothetical protein
MSTSVAGTRVIVAQPRDLGWVRGASFDFVFVIGVTLLALASGAVVTMRPEWFPIVLFLDLWLLGYHHVISTFTRLSFDKDSLREHRFLVLVLPWIVLAGTVLVGMTLGMWALATVYLYWQWFHYTRQSYGIVRIYGRKVGDIDSFDARLRNWVLYLTPLWGIAWRSYQDPDYFLGAPVYCLPVPLWAVYTLGTAALLATSIWAVRLVWASLQGRLHVALELYLLTHLVIFVTGYVLIENVDHGWLVLNVWHNAQYILIVWMYNNNRFKKGVEPQHVFLSSLSQSHAFNVACYFGVCLGLTTLVYGFLHWVLHLAPLAALPLSAMVIYQTINFHHYIVDGIIWKVRKKKLQQTLQIQGTT